MLKEKNHCSHKGFGDEPRWLTSKPHSPAFDTTEVRNSDLVLPGTHHMNFRAPTGQCLMLSTLFRPQPLD
jgi:nitrite reductase/ring-hydroxylating ferredoxin subunit